MTEPQRENLEKLGGRVTDVGELLDLSANEVKRMDAAIEQEQSEPSDEQIQEQLDSYEAYRRNREKSRVRKNAE